MSDSSDRIQNDRTLLRAAADGDDDACALIVERYTEMVWSIARSFRLAPADAADAAQTTVPSRRRALDTLRLTTRRS